MTTALQIQTLRPQADGEPSKPPGETGERHRPPPAGSIGEALATAKVVGYGPGVPAGSMETARDIERLVYARLGWEM